MAKGPGKGKTNNPNGRPKGIQNKTTEEAKELFNAVIEGQIENIESCLKKVQEKDPARFLEILAKYLNYIYPRGLDISSKGKSLTTKIIFVDEEDKQEI